MYTNKLSSIKDKINRNKQITYNYHVFQFIGKTNLFYLLREPTYIGTFNITEGIANIISA